LGDGAMVVKMSLLGKISQGLPEKKVKQESSKEVKNTSEKLNPIKSDLKVKKLKKEAKTSL
jgi:hypothetical protein